MKKIILTIFIIVSLFVAVSKADAVYAQVFKYELANPSQTISVGIPFQVKILINTTGVETIGGDALVVFDPVKISISSVVTGNFYTYFSANPLGGMNNKYLVSSWEESVAHSKKTAVDALFATMTLTAQSSGTTQISFDCIGNTGADSNIYRASDDQDIVQCPLTPLTINIGGTTGPSATPSPTGQAGATPTQAVTPSPTSVPVATATPRPTSTPVPTNTPRPTVAQMPRAGSMEITFAALGLGTLLTVMGILFIL